MRHPVVELPPLLGPDDLGDPAQTKEEGRVKNPIAVSLSWRSWIPRIEPPLLAGLVNDSGFAPSPRAVGGAQGHQRQLDRGDSPPDAESRLELYSPLSHKLPYGRKDDHRVKALVSSDNLLDDFMKGVLVLPNRGINCLGRGLQLLGQYLPFLDEGFHGRSISAVLLLRPMIRMFQLSQLSGLAK